LDLSPRGPSAHGIWTPLEKLDIYHSVYGKHENPTEWAAGQENLPRAWPTPGGPLISSVVHPAMEVLNSLLRWVEQQQLLTPLHSSVGGRVNLYADDLVLFIASMSKTYMLSRLHWQFLAWPPASF
jgi:midasin (ATPase involved in ribosome maturation)